MDLRIRQRSKEWRDEVDELKKSFFSNTSLHLLRPPARQFSNPNQAYLKSFSRLNSLASLPNIQSHLTRASTDHLKTSTSSTDNLSEPQSPFSPAPSTSSSSSSFAFNNDPNLIEIPVIDENLMKNFDKTIQNGDKPRSFSSSSIFSSNSSKFHQEFDMSSYQASEIAVLVSGKKLRIEACHSQTENMQKTKRRTKREMDLPEGTNVALLKSMFKEGKLIIFEDRSDYNMSNGFLTKVGNAVYPNEIVEDPPELPRKSFERSSNYRRSLSQPSRPTKPNITTDTLNHHSPNQVINQPVNPLYLQNPRFFPPDSHRSRNATSRQQNYLNHTNYNDKNISFDVSKEKMKTNFNFDNNVVNGYDGKGHQKQPDKNSISKQHFNGFNGEYNNYISNKINEILDQNGDLGGSQNDFTFTEPKQKNSLPDVVGSLGTRKEKEEEKHGDKTSWKHESKESNILKNNLMDLKKHPTSNIELTINTRPFNTTLKVGPGVEPQHLRIDAIDDVLIVSINNQFRCFSYTINLPFGLDPANVAAHLSDVGSLTLEEVAS